MAKLTVVEDEAALAHVAAERITARLEACVAMRGSAVVSLTGGSTPRRLYTLLADGSQPWRDRIDWPRLHLFWGDERHVPPDHPDSNFGMANDAMIRRVPVPAAQVHRMRGEMTDAAAAAADYERELRDGFGAAGRHDLTFDLMLLGLGEDAHIASLFPGRDYSTEPGLAMALWAAHLGAWRITLTPRALLDARDTMMVVAGRTKADAVHAAIEAPLDVSRAPAQLLRSGGDRVEWLVDRAAAARLSAS